MYVVNIVNPAVDWPPLVHTLTDLHMSHDFDLHLTFDLDILVNTKFGGYIFYT